MLAGTKYVLDLHENGRAGILIIEGNPGYGKTSYGVNILAEAHSLDGVTGNWDLDVFKRYMGFHPQKVLEKWRKAHHEKMFLWDDCAAWANAMDYQDPVIKKLGKLLQTIRTKYSCIVLTCLDADDLTKKFRMFAGAVTVRVSLAGCEPKSTEKYRKYRRTATAKHWEKDWYGKLFRKDDWNETFCCYMPLSFYDWYEPIRSHYADMLSNLTLKEAKNTKEFSSTVRFADI